MNHIYRVIWNAVTATWTAVAEIARGRGKKSSRAATRCQCYVAASGTLVLVPPFVLAQVASVVVAPGTNTNLNAYVAPNGATVVNINQANAAGLSHNQYKQFNVNAAGLVLNNTTSAQQASYQSQLAGEVIANLNQSSSARVILNEVVSNNRSTLAGFTEVLGAKADVVLANPYGVTCSGCGFINTDRVSLTTGNPFLSANGSLGGFRVGQGDILITGTGLNASAQQILDLVTRSVRIEAPINAQDLNIATGANQWSYDSRAITGTAAATGSTPTHSIDAALLGGMYANRIRLDSTEAGVGVRMLGDAAANASGFTLTAAGKIELKNHISAATDVNVRTTSTDAAALTLTDASLTSTANMALSSAGGASILGGALVAGNNLSISADSLLDKASTTSIANNNLRHAGGEQSLVVSNAASFGATQWGAVGAWSGAFGSLVTTGTTKLYSTNGALIASAEKGNLALGTAVLQSAGNMSLTSSGNISTAMGGGVQTLNGNLSLRAGNGIVNEGTMTADNGTQTIRADGTITNSGQIHAAQNLDIADSNGADSVHFTNTGSLLTEQALILKAAMVNNATGARIQARSGSTVDAASINNAGVWLLSQGGGASDKLTVRSALANSGTLQSANDLDVTAASLENSGTLLSASDLTANVSTDLRNNGNTAAIQAGKRLSVQGTNASLVTADGSRMLGDELAINLATIDNAGIIQAGNSSVTASGTLTNRATGVLTAATTAGGAGTVKAATLSNDGSIQSLGSLILGLGTGGLASSGKIIAEHDLTVQSRDSNDYTATVSGLMQSSNGTLAVNGTGASTLDIASTGTVVGKQLTATLGTISLADNAKLSSDRDMTLTLNTLNLAGENSAVLGSTDQTVPSLTRIATNNALNNNGLLFSGNDLVVSAPSVTNELTGGIAALHDLNITATTGNLTNKGALYAGNALTASVNSGTLTNTASLTAHQGTISAGKSIDLHADVLVNNSTIDSNGSISITARDLRNEVLGGDTRAYDAPTPRSKNQTGYDSYYNFPDDHEVWRYSETWHKDQSYSGGSPTVKPQITGAEAVTLTFNTGKNLGGVISGDTVTLAGVGAGATFINDELALHRTTYTRTWTEHTQYIALGPATYYDRRVEGDTTTERVTELSNIGAGVFARQLIGSNFALINNGSTAQPADMKKGAAQAVTISTVGGGAVTRGNVGGLTNGVTGSSALSFGGLNLALPTSPNGLYVFAKDPQAKYLIESNPRYQIGSSTVGSDYLAQRLGYNPDTLMRRLGDSSYEAYLIKQQLIAQTGNSLLDGMRTADLQVKNLMDSAAGQSAALGLIYGQALTPKQQSELKSDIVWMVQTEINGQVVLSPVVYLSSQTQSAVQRGAVITAQNAELNLASLTNHGAAIIGKDNLKVTSVGDVTNTSGLIQGGNVAIQSTQGSIVNQTAVTGSGGDHRYVTDIGKTASIQATGPLSLNSAKDITNTGATITAAGDVELKAGRNVSFDTIQNKSTDTTHGLVSQDGGTGTTSTTTTTITQVKSGLASGGNLSIDAGKDITLAGTDAKATGNAALNAGNNLNIVARENSKTTHTESHVSGFGVNNSLFGTTTTTTDSTSVRNVSSELQVGGNASLNAKNDITIQGSNVDVKGNGRVSASTINVLAGRDYDETHSTVERSGFLQVSSASDTSKQANASAQANLSDASISAKASANAGVGATASAGLALYATTKTVTDTTDLRHVGSSLTFGKDLQVDASKDINLQGSKLKAAGDAKVNAENINLLAAEDKKTSQTSTESLSIGLMASTDNKLDARASAELTAGAKPKTNPNAKIGASAQVSANSENHLDVLQYTKSTTSTLTTTHKGSSIEAGGDLGVKAKQNLVLEGSSLNADGNIDLAAQRMDFKAVHDVNETRSSESKTTAGLYVTGTANAGADAGAGVGIGAQASASVQAKARAEVGLYASNTRSENLEGSTTAVTSSISAGKNITRIAKESITDVGTSIDAGGDLTQSAKTIRSLAAADTEYSSSSKNTDTAKIGAYVEAQAQASVSITGAEKGASAGGGITASYKHDDSGSETHASQAVVSNIKVGGSVRSTSTDKTELEGTNISAKNDVALNAGSLNYKAARNTSSSSENTTTAGGSVDVDIIGKSANLSASYNGSKQSELRDQAVVGSIKAGGNLSVQTTGDARFEGSNLEAGGAVSLAAGGKTTFDAAVNREESRSQNVGVDAGLSVGKKSISGNLGVQVGVATSSREQEVGGSIRSGSGPINVQSKGDASFTGVTFDAGKNDVAVATAGNLTFTAAHDRKESSSVDASAGISGSKGKSPGQSNYHAGLSKNYSETGAPNAALGLEKSNSDTVAGTEIRSTGKVTLTAGKNMQQQNVKVVGTTNLQETAGGTSEKTTLQSTSDGFGIVAFAPEIKVPAGKGSKGKGQKTSDDGLVNTPNSLKGVNENSTDSRSQPKAQKPQSLTKASAPERAESSSPTVQSLATGPDTTTATPQKQQKPENVAKPSSPVTVVSTQPTSHSGVAGAEDTKESKPGTSFGAYVLAKAGVNFKPPKDIGDGRVGYLLSPTKPVAGESIGTLGADRQPLAASGQPSASQASTPASLRPTDHRDLSGNVPSESVALQANRSVETERPITNSRTLGLNSPQASISSSGDAPQVIAATSSAQTPSSSGAGIVTAQTAQPTGGASKPQGGSGSASLDDAFALTPQASISSAQTQQKTKIVTAEIVHSGDDDVASRSTSAALEAGFFPNKALRYYPNSELLRPSKTPETSTSSAQLPSVASVTSQKTITVTAEVHRSYDDVAPPFTSAASAESAKGKGNVRGASNNEGASQIPGSSVPVEVAQAPSAASVASAKGKGNAKDASDNEGVSQVSGASAPAESAQVPSAASVASAKGTRNVKDASGRGGASQIPDSSASAGVELVAYKKAVPTNDAGASKTPVSPKQVALESFIDKNLAVFDTLADALPRSEGTINPIISRVGGSYEKRADLTKQKLIALKDKLANELNETEDVKIRADLLKNANVKATKIIAEGHSSLEKAARYSKKLALFDRSPSRREALNNIGAAEKLAQQNSVTNNQIARLTREQDRIVSNFPANFKDKKLSMPGEGISETNSVEASLTGRVGFGPSATTSAAGTVFPQRTTGTVVGTSFNASADLRGAANLRKNTEISRANDGNLLLTKVTTVGGNVSVGGQVGVGLDLDTLTNNAATTKQLRSADVAIGVNAAARAEVGGSRNIKQAVALTSTPVDAHGMLLFVNMVEPSNTESASSRSRKDNSVSKFLWPSSKLETGDLADVTMRRLQRGYQNEDAVLQAYNKIGINGQSVNDLYAGPSLATQFMSDAAKEKPEAMGVLPKVLPKPLWLTRDTKTQVVYGRVSAGVNARALIPGFGATASGDVNISRSVTTRTTESAKLPHQAFDAGLSGSLDRSAKYTSEYFRGSSAVLGKVGKPIAEALGVDMDTLVHSMSQLDKTSVPLLNLDSNSAQRVVEKHQEFTGAVNRFQRFVTQNDPAIKKTLLKEAKDSLEVLNGYGFNINVSDKNLMSMSGSNTKKNAHYEDILTSVATIEESYSAVAGGLKVQMQFDATKKFNPQTPLRVVAVDSDESGAAQPGTSASSGNQAAVIQVTDERKAAYEKAVGDLYKELDSETLPFHRVTLVNKSSFTRGFENSQPDRGQSSSTVTKFLNVGVTGPSAFGMVLTSDPKVGDNFVPELGYNRNIGGLLGQKSVQTLKTPFDYTDPGQTGTTIITRQAFAWHNPKPSALNEKSAKGKLQTLVQSALGRTQYKNKYVQEKWQKYTAEESGRKFSAYKATGTQQEDQKRLGASVTVPVAPGASIGVGTTASRTATKTEFDSIAYGNDVGARAIVAKKLFKEWFGHEELKDPEQLNSAVSKFQDMIRQDPDTANLLFGFKGTDPISSQLSQMRNLMLDDRDGNFDPPFRSGGNQGQMENHVPIHNSKGEQRANYEDRSSYIDKTGFMGYVLNEAPQDLDKQAVKTWIDKRVGVALPKASDIDALLIAPHSTGVTVQQYLKGASKEERVNFYASPEGSAFVKEFLVTTDFAGHLNDFVFANNTYKHTINPDVRAKQQQLLKPPSSRSNPAFAVDVDQIEVNLVDETTRF